MLICGFIDFDDTIFPSTFMTKFFNKEQGVFLPLPPKPVIDHLAAIDRLVTNFIIRHMVYCRFRIITHAGLGWIYQALQFMPVLHTVVAWNYIQIIPCENFTKFSKLHDIVSKEQSGDIYFCCGDSPHDVESLPEVINKLHIATKLRSILFVRKPDLSALQFQWERLHDIFMEMIKAREPTITRHFVITEDCKHYANPGWYSTQVEPALTPKSPHAMDSPPRHPTTPSGSIQSLHSSGRSSGTLPVILEQS
jgi:hypothetical protein